MAKSGNSILTLSGGANSYTGATTVTGGALNVSALANGGSASDIGASANTASNLTIDGATLDYTGSGASSDHLFTIGSGGPCSPTTARRLDAAIHRFARRLQRQRPARPHPGGAETNTNTLYFP